MGLWETARTVLNNVQTPGVLDLAWQQAKEGVQEALDEINKAKLNGAAVKTEAAEPVVSTVPVVIIQTEKAYDVNELFI